MVKVAQSRKRNSVRKHGLSRTEKLLVKSISHECNIRRLWSVIATLQRRLAVLERQCGG
jgi:hypothetical protein